MFQRNGDEPFYERKNAYRNNGIVSLAGCGLMVAATFLYWMMLYVKTTARSKLFFERPVSLPQYERA